MKDKDIHAYYNGEGKRIPSVTQVVSLLAKQGISEWANMLGFYHKNYDKVLKEYAENGTRFHEAAEKYILDGELPNYNDPFISSKHLESLKKRMELFTNWFDNHEITPIYIEKKFVSDDLGGTIDMYCLLDDKYTLLDFKTSKNVRETHVLQLAGYLNLIRDTGHYDLYDKLDQVMVLSVHPDTGLHEYTKTIEEMKEYRFLFYRLLVLFKDWNSILSKDWGKDIYKK